MISEKSPLTDVIDWDERYLVYKTLIFITFILNFDTGVFPPAIQEISAELSLTYPQIAFIGNKTYLIFLGGVTYFGLCINTLYFSYLIKNYRAKPLLLSNLSINILACMGVTLSLNYYLFVFFRVIQGMTMGFYLTFTPLWVNKQAPDSK